jgi:beta-N-acetylhexosaminidase
MTLAQKIAGLCCPAYVAGATEGFLDTGSFFVFAGQSAAQRETIARASAACSAPPVITTDLEYGAGRMIQDATRFPSLFAAGLAGPALAEEMGRIAAAEGRAVGFHWTLAPCVDPIIDIGNPTTSYRSAGRDPQTVIDIGRAYIRGLQAGGMLATAKHFPGDGACLYDQHLTTPGNPLGMEAWHKTYGRIYAAMIDEGVAAIMPGHISLPAYDTSDPSNGLHPPATLSPRLMNDLLRGELGFDGLIVSDAVNMGGFCGFTNYHDACARFLEAGGDVLLFARPTQVFLDEMLKRIDSGLLTEAALDDRLARFGRFKKRALSMPAVDNVQLRAPAALATADHVVVAGVQLLRDRQGWLPISRPGTKRILHVRIALAHSVMHPVVDQFQTALREVFASVESIADPGPDRLRELTESGAHDALIVSVLNEYGYGVNHIHLAGPIARNMMGGWMHLGKPVIFISHAHPYLHCEYQAAMNCVIRTCGTVEATIPRLIEIIAREGAQVVADEVG